MDNSSAGVFILSAVCFFVFLQAIERTHVNLVDLVEARGVAGRVRIFPSRKTLAAYTNATGKIFPRKHAKAGGLLRELLRPIDSPPTSKRA